MLARSLGCRKTMFVQAAVTMGMMKVSYHSKADMESSESGTTKSNITLYQYKICPFCHRVKAVLDFMNIKYEIVEVSPLTKSQLSFSEYKKVPVIKIDETLLNESGGIVKYLIDPSKFNTDIKFTKNFIPDDNEKWMEWSEKKLAVMLYPNITRSYNESWECFNYTKDVTQWSYPERKMNHVLGAFAMTLANGKIKKKYGIVNEREELNTVLNEWIQAIHGKSFLHGNDVTLPDLMVYGVLRSIEGLTTFNEIMDANNELKAWYVRVDTSLPRKS